MTSPARKIGLAARMFAFYGIADKLPYSPTAGLGKPAQRVRRAVTTGMFDHAGESINIERGAWFGSGKGISIGDRSGIGLDCLVLGTVTIGNDVMMGPRCLVVSETHETADTAHPMNTQGMGVDRPVVIEDDVWLSGHVVVLPGVRIGRGSIVAAGAVVADDVPPYSVVAGVPARVVRTRTKAEGNPA